MSDAVDLIQLLAEVGGLDLAFHRTNAVLAVAVVQLPEDRQVLAIERTYREGICVIFDPTPEEVSVAREGDLWKLWNSERAQDLDSIE